MSWRRVLVAVLVLLPACAPAAPLPAECPRVRCVVPIGAEQ